MSRAKRAYHKDREANESDLRGARGHLLDLDDRDCALWAVPLLGDVGDDWDPADSQRPPEQESLTGTIAKQAER